MKLFFSILIGTLLFGSLSWAKGGEVSTDLNDLQLSVLPEQCFAVNVMNPEDFFFMNKKADMSPFYKVSDLRDYKVTEVVDRRLTEGTLKIDGVITGTPYERVESLESWAAVLNGGSGSLTVTIEKLIADTKAKVDKASLTTKMNFRVFCSQK